MINVKCLTAIYILILLLPMTGCDSQALSSEQEMLDAIRNEESLTEEYELMVVHSQDNGDYLILCVAAISNTDMYGDRFFIAGFNEVRGGHKFYDSTEMLVRGREIAMHRGPQEQYWIVTTNPEAKALYLEYKDGRTETIPVESVPFFYSADSVMDKKGASEVYTFPVVYFWDEAGDVIG